MWNVFGKRFPCPAALTSGESRAGRAGTADGGQSGSPRSLGTGGSALPAQAAEAQLGSGRPHRAASGSPALPLVLSVSLPAETGGNAGSETGRSACDPPRPCTALLLRLLKLLWAPGRLPRLGGNLSGPAEAGCPHSGPHGPRLQREPGFVFGACD